MKPYQQIVILVILLPLLALSAQSVSAFYDPSLGRWINRDPIQERGGLDLYIFNHNSPIQTYDAFGLIAPIPGGGYTPPPGAILVPTCGTTFLCACMWSCARQGMASWCVTYVYEGPEGPLDVHLDIVCYCLEIKWPGRPR